VETTAWGHGLATIGADGRTLDTWYPAPALGTTPDGAEANTDLTALAGADDCATARGVRLEIVHCEIDLTAEGITQRSAWSRPVTIAWKDVRDVKLALSGEVLVYSRRGTKVRVSVHLDGMSTLADALEAHLGHLKSTASVAKRAREYRDKVIRSAGV